MSTILVTVLRNVLQNVIGCTIGWFLTKWLGTANALMIVAVIGLSATLFYLRKLRKQLHP